MDFARRRLKIPPPLKHSPPPVGGPLQILAYESFITGAYQSPMSVHAQ